VQPLLQWKSNEYYTTWVCVFFSLRYPACKAHAPYCHLWPAPLYSVFLHYLINGTIFEKKKLPNTKCVFRLYLQLLSGAFLILRRNERDMIKKMYIGLHVKYRYSCPILMTLDFSRQIFETSSNVKFHGNPSSRSRVVSSGRTDRHVEADSRVSQFCERA